MRGGRAWSCIGMSVFLFFSGCDSDPASGGQDFGPGVDAVADTPVGKEEVEDAQASDSQVPGDLAFPDLALDGAGDPNCTPGAVRCEGNVALTCAPSGLEWTAWDCASDGLVCRDNACRSEPVSCVKLRPIELRTNQPVPASVAVVFAVDDCNGAPVLGLKIDNFRMYENDKAISQAESSATLLDRGAEVYLSLVLDNSPSVKAAGALPQAVAAAKQYVEQVMVSPSVFAGVWFFSKSLTSRQAYTTDKAAVLAALDALLTDETGSNTTNLFGSIIEILGTSQSYQQQRREGMAGGITTLGQVVLFTDGSDQAALKTFDEAKRALGATTDDVIAIALGGEIEPDVIKVLGKDGWFIAETAEDLQAQFGEAAKRTKGLQKRIYILGYCSPKLAGNHLLTIQVVSGDQTLGASEAVPFDASNFDTSSTACSPFTFEHACDGKSCGGLLCGVCGKGSCNNSTFQCQCANPTCSGFLCDEEAASICDSMVTVPAGSFWQGCNESVDTDCRSDEKPYHQVNVPAFEIDKYAVTVGWYGDCVSAGACTAASEDSPYCNQGKSGKHDHPMNCITWHQAREYCSWAGKRLCSESEWEKASRGTDGRKYPWGNEDPTCDYAVMLEGGAGCKPIGTMVVGSKPAGASPYGALDMSGNVFEWVEDDWHDNYTGAPTDGSAWVNDPRASSKGIRGGNYLMTDIDLRSSSRNNWDATPADSTLSHLGVRCCRSVEP